MAVAITSTPAKKQEKKTKTKKGGKKSPKK